MQTSDQQSGCVGLLEKRVHVALPIRVLYRENGRKMGMEMACTYDIYSRGARVAGLRGVQQVGEIITVERGRQKALCRVAWIGAPESELRGQFGIECIEKDKTMFETELQEMEELYDPILLGQVAARGRSVLTNPGENRRCRPRFAVEGIAELVQAATFVTREACVSNLSAFGCLIRSHNLVAPGTDVKLALKVTDCDITVKGRVRHAAHQSWLGVEFHEIRKGDRPVLEFLLRTLALDQGEPESVPIELTDVPF